MSGALAPSPPAGPSRRRKVVFVLTAFTVPFVTLFGAFLALDMHLHSKYQMSAGFNVWGYRGPVVGRKRLNEYRVAVVGGSSAFGYGVTWREAIPAQLENRLARQVSDRIVRVLNLAYNNEGAYSFTFTLNDYDYLKYDLVCLYEGYNDLTGDPRAPNVSVFRHDSPIFRLTGYLPIFPIVAKEKAASMLAGGDPGALYRSDTRTVFRPGVATKMTASVLRTAGEVGQSLEHQLGRVTVEPSWHIDAADATGCKYPWGQYCRSIANAIELTLAKGRQVLFITQPYGAGTDLRIRHQEQQREAAAVISRQFGSDARVGYVNLGDAIDLTNSALSFDRMHLTPEGNARIAGQLVAPVMAMLSRRTAAPSRH